VKKVEPIRSREKIIEMEEILKIDSYRNFVLFKLGINIGLRISDLLQLKVKDIKNKSHIEIREGKTKKFKRQALNPELKMIINNYIKIKKLSDEEYIFKSRKGNNKPIGRIQAYRILKSAAEKIGLKHIGTHSLRKTYGFHHYKKNKDIAILQEIFNHSSPSITLRYIGINQDIKDQSTKNFYL